MNITMQLEAVDYLAKAWDAHSTDQKRMDAFAERFRAAHPNYFWYVVFDYHHVSCPATYYIEMKIRKKGVYLFSAKV